MKNATAKEFRIAIGNAHWPRPERCHAGRTSDETYKDMEGVRGLCGTLVAQKTSFTSRGKVVDTIYMVNPDYLD